MTSAETTAYIQECIRYGARLPSSDLEFDPPLMIRSGEALRGSVRTRLFPSGNGPGNTLVWVQSMPYGVHDGVDSDADSTGLPRGGRIEDIIIHGRHPEDPQSVYGVWVQGARVRMRNVGIVQCHHGLACLWSVDNVFQDMAISQNLINVDIRGDDTGKTSVTTTRFVDCNLRQAIHRPHIPNSGTGLLARTGYRTMLVRSIIESNEIVGLDATRGVQTPIVVDHCWFENNGQHWRDAGGKLQIMGEASY